MKVRGWWMRWPAAALLIAAVVAGCGRTGFATRPPSTDSSALASWVSTPPSSPAPFSTSSAAPSAPPDETITNATMIYYDVTGSTAQELRAQMSEDGPLSDDGHRFDARTNWYISWSWPGYGTRTCNLQDVTVTYRITVTFPHWVEPANPNPALVSRWSAYTQALATHEEGHVDFVVSHYQAVATAVKNATCLTADAAAQAALQPIRQHDLDYDAATNHGATQGATFP